MVQKPSMIWTRPSGRRKDYAGRGSSQSINSTSVERQLSLVPVAQRS